MEEMLDLVNEQGDPIGRAVPRSEAHRLGLRHRTSHVWLVRRKNGVLEFCCKSAVTRKILSPAVTIFPVRDISRPGRALWIPPCGS